MNEKTCRKCGHVAAFGTFEPMSCMECGAVYSKVEEALRGGSPSRSSSTGGGGGASSRFGGSSRGAWAQTQDFAQRMREESLYPVWRQLVGVVTLIGYAVAAIVALAAVVAMFKGAGFASVGGLCFALLIAVVARVGKEASLMLADLSDASVRLAARAGSD